MCPPALAQLAAVDAFSRSAYPEGDSHVARATPTNRGLLLGRACPARDRAAGPADGAFYVYDRRVAPDRRHRRTWCLRLLAESGSPWHRVSTSIPGLASWIDRLSFAGATADIAEALERLAGWLQTLGYLFVTGRSRATGRRPSAASRGGTNCGTARSCAPPARPGCRRSSARPRPRCRRPPSARSPALRLAKLLVLPQPSAENPRAQSRLGYLVERRRGRPRVDVVLGPAPRGGLSIRSQRSNSTAATPCRSAAVTGSAASAASVGDPRRRVGRCR